MSGRQHHPSSPTDPWALLHGGLRWRVPARFNIAQACCARWAADPAVAPRTAIAWDHEDGRSGTLSYAALHQQSLRLAAALAGLGVKRGDRVAVVMPQRPETAVSHMALYHLGAVAMPLSMLFGPEALAFRLQDSAAVLALVDEWPWARRRGRATSTGPPPWPPGAVRRRRPTPAPTTRPCSSTPAAPPARPRAR